MSAPFSPEDFENLVARPGQNICLRIVNRFRFRVMVWKFMRWMLSETGELSAAFKEMLCAIDCDDFDPTTTTTSSTTTCAAPQFADPPVNATLTNVGGCTWEFAWNYPDGAISVDVYITKLPSGEVEEVSYNSPQTTQQFEIPAGDEWCFAWRACSACGCTEYLGSGDGGTPMCGSCPATTTTTTTPA